MPWPTNSSPLSAPRASHGTEKLAEEKSVGRIQRPSNGAHVDLRLLKSTGQNVLALLPVNGAKSTVAVGAHLDHLGRGESGNSLSKSPGIHPGADDNLRVCRSLRDRSSVEPSAKEAKQTQTKCAFLVFGRQKRSGPRFSALRELLQITLSAYLNLDMVGRYVTVFWFKAWHRQRVGAKSSRKSLHTDLVIKTQGDPYVPSDALTFYMKGIPSLCFSPFAH